MEQSSEIRHIVGAELDTVTMKIQLVSTPLLTAIPTARNGEVCD